MRAIYVHVHPSTRALNRDACGYFKESMEFEE
jgi:hypothetical protein